MSNSAYSFDKAKADDCILRLVQLKHDFGACGLFGTMHALEPATKKAGWELAELMQVKQD